MNDHGQYQCVVESVISERGGGCIFKARLDDERVVQVLLPYDLRAGAAIGKGQYYRIEGIESVHPKYGTQIKASAFVPATPTTTENIHRFIAHAPEMRGIGIGKKKALMLIDIFGQNLAQMLHDGEAEAIASGADGLVTEHSARTLCDRWRTNSDLARTAQFLDEYGVTGRLATLIYGVYGKRTETALKDDPFRLIAFRTPSRKAWFEVLSIARRLGVDPGDTREAIGALEFAIYRQHEAGHTAVTAHVLVKDIASLLGGRKSAENAFALGLRAGLIVEHRGLIQHIGARRLEETIERDFSARMRRRTLCKRSRGSQGALFPIPNDAAGLEALLSNWEHDNFVLNAQQRDAVSKALSSKISVITGGAGVGKTSALRALADIATEQGRDVHFLALAGRAAMRIREATGHSGGTIAGFLSGVRKRRIAVQKSGIVIVDEASMISLPEIIRTLRCAGDASLVFVGDDYQLPPISFGEVFPHLTTESNVPSSRLSQVYRQSAQTGIPTCSEHIRDQHVPDFSAYEGPSFGVSFIRCPQTDIERHVLEVYKELAERHECQVICMTNGGVAGTKKINKLFQGTFSKDDDQLVQDGVRLDDPVMHLINDYDRGLCNGSLGRVTRLNRERAMIQVQWDEGFVTELPIASLHFDFEIAYGITCHKAQGSQFDKVIVPIRPAKNLDNRMLYTAITRAKTQVVLVGEFPAFTQAVTRPPSELRRCTGFSMVDNA